MTLFANSRSALRSRRSDAEKLGGGGEPPGRLPLGPVAHHLVNAPGHAARGAGDRLERHLVARPLRHTAARSRAPRRRRAAPACGARRPSGRRGRSTGRRRGWHPAPARGRRPESERSRSRPPARPAPARPPRPSRRSRPAPRAPVAERRARPEATALASATAVPPAPAYDTVAPAEWAKPASSATSSDFPALAGPDTNTTRP